MFNLLKSVSKRTRNLHECVINSSFSDQLVPVPSIFFIHNGIPMKIVTSAVKSIDELEDTIKSLMKNSQETSTSSTSQSNDDIVCEGGVCYKKSEKPEEKSSPVETEEEKQEKIKKAMKLIEEKRIERIKEEQRLEKEREIQRRKDGQEIQNLKKWQKDEELKQLKDDRMRERNEEKAARQKILDQIAQDKKERAAKFANQPVAENSEQPKPTTSIPPPVANSKQARIQFKKPNGETEIVTFDSDMVFADLHAFVKSDILQGSSEKFVLATTFPRREFSNEDFNKTLLDLKLSPSSVLLIIFGNPSTLPTTSSSTQSENQSTAVNTFSSIFFTILTPILAFFTFLKGFLTRAVGTDEAGKRKRNEEILTPNDAAKKRNLNAFLNSNQPSTSSSSSPTGTVPKSNAFKRPNSSNIHRLHENSDDDEDKKTYNGNSTQQL